MPENYILGIESKTFLSLFSIGGALLVAVTAFVLKACYDYRAEKIKNKESNNSTYNQTLFLLIKLYELVGDIKKNIKTYEDRELNDIDRFLAAISRLKDSFDDTVEELARIDPLIASKIDYQTFVDNISHLISAGQKTKTTVSIKKNKSKSHKQITPEQLRLRILGIEKLNERLNTLMRNNVEIQLSAGIPMLLTAIKSAMHLIAQKIDQKTLKETLEKYPINNQDQIDFFQLKEKVILFHQESNTELESISKKIRRF